MDSSRLLFYGAWGGGVVLLFSIVLIRRIRGHRRHRDRRAFRDLLEAIGLWLVSFAASAAVASLIFFPEGATLRGLLNAIALGAFLGVGVIMATEERATR